MGQRARHRFMPSTRNRLCPNWYTNSRNWSYSKDTNTPASSRASDPSARNSRKANHRRHRPTSRCRTVDCDTIARHRAGKGATPPRRALVQLSLVLAPKVRHSLNNRGSHTPASAPAGHNHFSFETIDAYQSRLLLSGFILEAEVYAHEDKRKAATTIQNWFWHKKTWKRDGQRSYHHSKLVLAQENLET